MRSQGADPCFCFITSLSLQHLRYAFAKAHKVLLIDEFDLINKDLHIYRAFKPASIRLRLEHMLAEFDKTWVIRIINGDVRREGELENHDRAHGVVRLMERFAHELPDMKIGYNGHDGARVGLAAVERERLEGLIRRGECACPASSPTTAKVLTCVPDRKSVV